MPLSDEQKKLRMSAYGSSEVATIVSPDRSYRRLIELYEAKRTGRYEDDDDENLPAELGVLEEAPVARVYAQRTSTYVCEVAPMRHPTKELAMASPDRARFITEAAMNEARGEKARIWSPEGIALADRLVEVKTHALRYRRDYGDQDTGQVPEGEAIQVTWQMGVTGARVADLAVLFRGDFGLKFEIFTVAFNEALFEALYEQVERFHVEHVLRGVPPPPDGSDEYDKAMGRMFPHANEKHVVASEEEERMMLDYAKLQQVEDRAENLRKRIGQQLMQRIGEARGMTSASLGKMSWISRDEGVRVSWKKAANDALQLGGLVLDGLKRLREKEAVPTPESLAELENRLKSIIPDASKPQAGYRYMRFFPKKGSEADLQLARLNMVLDALDPGASE